jgi:fatty-acyl-CoA synthase
MADYNEVGLLTSEINQNNVNTRFDGYSDTQSTEKKILSSVFEKDDHYFNTGDLIYRDAEGFFYWSDRVGDTFRWKGENVATTEVENCLTSVCGVSEVTVYGVTIPNCDGRVGMASLILHEKTSVGGRNTTPAGGGGETGLEWERSFHEECQKHLPPYARPAFIRIQRAIQVTGTFKHQKAGLIEEGYDPEKMKGDLLYLYNQKEGKMIPMTRELYQQIQTGAIKL